MFDVKIDEVSDVVNTETFHEEKNNSKKIVISKNRDSLLTKFGKATLDDRYLIPGESYQDLFARVSSYYADNDAHAQRLYDYMSKLWFMPSTPVLSNGGTERGLPISCFLNEVQDSMKDIVNLWDENVWLAYKGGGIGSYWGNVRSIGEPVKGSGKTSGIMPFLKVMDSMTLAISQGSLRRGSAATYLPIWHPEIEEFIEMRRPTGGDPNRKSLNLNHGVVITDDFMKAVELDADWKLISPKTKQVMKRIKARELWIRLLTARIETGEPYLLFIDNVNKRIPLHHKNLGLNVKTSNLCVEITLPTGLDHLGNMRTAVCCLSSLNLEYFHEWRTEPLFIEDCLRFLDNVMDDFIKKAPPEMKNAVYAAMRERSVGLGVMGFHSFLQGQMIAIESTEASRWNKVVFSHIKNYADAASKKLAVEKGPCPDAAEYGIMERFSNKIAIAPTASISIICGGTSPGIEPVAANSYTHKTLSGSFPVRSPYLEKVLEKYGKNDEDTWSDITLKAGSVQHLDFLSKEEKDVFKTAFEIDQFALIDLAADRTPFICQGQSLNLFLPADIHKSKLHRLHLMAWKKGVKSLYYCRSKSIQRAESNESKKIEINIQNVEPKYEECLACQ